jgi:NADH-quinone oxidoreductase subunit G
VLSVAERGDRALIGKFEGQDLTHPWAGNVIDLCPVGALLSKDSLNKARAWDLDRSASVCPNCSQGCNMIVETRDNQVVRLRPRSNEAVNKFFMCDHGRLNYRWMNRPDRVDQPMVRQNGALATADWEIALRSTAQLLNGKRAFVLASPNLSNEALFLLGKLVRRTSGAGAFRVNQGPEAPLPGVEDLALRPDRAANVKGAEMAGFTRADSPLAGMQAGDVLVVADEELDAVDAAAAAKAGAIVVMGTTLPAWARHGATVVLPIANCVEEDGTFTNLRGRVQRFLQAKAAPGLARPSYFVVGDLLAAMGEGQGYWTASAVFDALAASQPAFAGMSYDTLALKGAVTSDAMAGARA